MDAAAEVEWQDMAEDELVTPGSGRVFAIPL
ncbi:hypothetical protein H4W32_000064 [Actinophytocola algeriensis]|uniref:Uncharacterized protein n=1 Tax=Actinophytocola algeriensis TaxID=1768010 RepID=A0A7W7VJU0_9PSEU|nr:hypothetical protein [Actinophytocola algeriensis]MBE1472022.1 hypothetical protein [Actinophytocola algeriensis]